MRLGVAQLSVEAHGIHRAWAACENAMTKGVYDVCFSKMYPNVFGRRTPKRRLCALRARCNFVLKPRKHTWT